jgi:hypothetical protein
MRDGRIVRDQHVSVRRNAAVELAGLPSPDEIEEAA